MILFDFYENKFFKNVMENIDMIYAQRLLKTNLKVS